MSSFLRGIKWPPGWWFFWGAVLFFALYQAEPESFSVKGLVFLIGVVIAGWGATKLFDKFLPPLPGSIATSILIYAAFVTVFRSADIGNFRNWTDQLTLRGGATAGLSHLLGTIIGLGYFLKWKSDQRHAAQGENFEHVAGPEGIEEFQASGASPLGNNDPDE